MIWKISNSRKWEDLQTQFDWVRDMAGVPQDPVHHAEGDVETHVRMVIDRLLELPEFGQLGPQDQEILFAATLLHDVEKRSTTVVEPDGSVTARGHSRKGEKTSRQLLYQRYPTPFFIREHVAKLVRHHGSPLWAVERDDPHRMVIRASLEVDTRLLAMLAKADALGRICHDQEDLLYRIGYFEELCKENKCWGQPRSFANNQARTHYLNHLDSYPDYVPFDDTQFEAVVMCGLPGAGKDTWIQNNLSDLPVISSDEIRRMHKLPPRKSNTHGKVFQIAREEARVFMRKRQPFVWNATNLTGQIRQQVMNLFREYGGRVRLVYVEVPYERLLGQNANRQAKVPDNVVRRMARKLEPPTIGEAEKVDYVIG